MKDWFQHPTPLKTWEQAITLVRCAQNAALFGPGKFLESGDYTIRLFLQPKYIERLLSGQY